jgi:hypothetical protein
MVVVIGLVLLAALFSKLFRDPFFYFSTDNSELYFAWLVMLSRALHHGYWPFLNPYWFAGSLPFAPLESGAMYPVTLLAAAITNPSWSLDTIYFVFLGLSFSHYLLGACSMHLLLRRSFGLGVIAALFGALCYAFGGSFLGRFSHQPVLFTLAWLPLAVGGAMQFVRTRALPQAALAIAAIWSMGVSSHPQLFLYGFAVVAATVAWFSLTEDPSLRWAKLRRGAIVLGLALGLLAPRILPWYEFSRVTVRPASFTTIANLFDSLSPLYYLTLLVPNLFGRHLIGYWGTDHPLGNWDSLLYVGVLPTLCAAFCIFHKPRRDWAFALTGVGAAFFLMLGKHWTVSAWVNQHLPLSTVLSSLSKLTIVFHFFFVLLVAFGVQALLGGARRARLALMALGVASAVVGIFVWLTPEVVHSLAPAGRAAPSEEAVRFAMQSVRQARWIALASIATMVAAIFVRRAGPMLFIPVLVADLVVSLGSFNPIEATKGEPSIHYGDDAGFRFMQQDTDTFRVAHLEPRNGGMIFSLEAVQGYHTVLTRAYSTIQSFLDFHDRTRRSMYNLANIKYERLRSDLSSDNFAEVAPGVWRNQEALPRAFFLGRCRGFADTDDMTRSVLSQSIEPSRELMLFASDCRQGVGGDGSCALRAAAEGGERYAANCTVGAGGGWAFFSVLQYPGWSAAVDGREAELVPAAIAFYAVPLSAGQHHVELVYRSRGLFFGLWIAGATGIVALGLAGWSVRARRRNRVSGRWSSAPGTP